MYYDFLSTFLLTFAFYAMIGHCTSMKIIQPFAIFLMQVVAYEQYYFFFYIAKCLKRIGLALEEASSEIQHGRLA